MKIDDLCCEYLEDRWAVLDVHNVEDDFLVDRVDAVVDGDG